jgi:hypothetical protein
VRAIEPIPPAEELYRGATEEHLAGESVEPDAIDGEGSSCNRQRYASPESVLGPVRTRTIYTTPDALRQLPSPLTLSNGVAYEVFAVDLPIEGNNAHCEVRWRRVDNAQSTEHAKIKSTTMRLEMKAWVARAFRVFG